MNEERRFKIAKVKKYNEKIKDEKFESAKDIAFLGLCALLVVYDFMSGQRNDISEFSKICYPILGTLQSGLGIIFLKKLINSICKKTSLESLRDEMKEELGELSWTEEEYLNNKEENKGRGR